MQTLPATSATANASVSDRPFPDVDYAAQVRAVDSPLSEPIGANALLPFLFFARASNDDVITEVFIYMTGPSAFDVLM